MQKRDEMIAVLLRLQVCGVYLLISLHYCTVLFKNFLVLILTVQVKDELAQWLPLRHQGRPRGELYYLPKMPGLKVCKDI